MISQKSKANLTNEAHYCSSQLKLPNSPRSNLRIFGFDNFISTQQTFTQGPMHLFRENSLELGRWDLVKIWAGKWE
jgi:hypothetical protein